MARRSTGLFAAPESWARATKQIHSKGTEITVENQITPSPVPPVDPKLFRQTMGCFATGVTIVTTKSDGDLYGMTVNSFTAVSLQPTLVLICLANDAHTTAAVRARGWFAVNILEERQVALSNHFARPEEDRFAGLDFTLNEYELPVLPDCVAHLMQLIQTALHEIGCIAIGLHAANGHVRQQRFQRVAQVAHRRNTCHPRASFEGVQQAL